MLCFLWGAYMFMKTWVLHLYLNVFAINAHQFLLKIVHSESIYYTPTHCSAARGMQAEQKDDLGLKNTMVI